MTSAPLSKDKKKIAGMFNEIAPHYDFLNHFLSFNIDRSWRRRLVKKVCAAKSSEVLDLACGTGDVTLSLAKKGIKVTGMDISEKMLDIAKSKKHSVGEIAFINAPADSIPFPDDSFDAVTISFGIRNFDHRPKCIEEIHRIIRPGGIVAILEFTIPQNKLWKSIYTFYFRKFLPAIGKTVSRQQFAYTYLPLSAFEFPQREAFCSELEDGGFKDVSYDSMTGGIACLYIGTK